MRKVARELCTRGLARIVTATQTINICGSQDGVSRDLVRSKANGDAGGEDDRHCLGIRVEVVLADERFWPQSPTHDHEGAEARGDIGRGTECTCHVRQWSDGAKSDWFRRVAHKFYDDVWRKARIEAGTEVVPRVGSGVWHGWIVRGHRVPGRTRQDRTGQGVTRPDRNWDCRLSCEVKHMSGKSSASLYLTVDACDGPQVVRGVTGGKEEGEHIIDIVADVGIEDDRDGGHE
jgi:hypothetical protein